MGENAGVNHGSIPLFPPMCVQHAPEHICDSFGIKVACVATFPQDVAFTETAAHGHWLVTILLLIISALNFSFVDWNNRGAHFMKIQTSLYALITAGFAFARFYWNVSQLLLVGAALHNLFEWFFFIQISDWVKNVQDFFRIVYSAMFFIAVILVLVVIMPTLLMSVGVEQAFGIMMDFALVIGYASGYMANIKNAGKDTIDTGDAGKREKNETIKQHQLGLGNFYAVPLLAHGIHLTFTILPLVFVNFHTQTVSLYSSYFLEGSVYLTVPITHLLYMHWGIVFDRIRSDSNTGDSTDNYGVLPEQLRVKNPSRILLVSFFLGMIPLMIIPKFILGDCPLETTCPSSPVLVGTAVATLHKGSGPAWETWIAENDLIATAQKQKGNLQYAMVKSATNPDEYRFVERWDSVESVQLWMQSGLPRKLFTENAITQNLLKGGRLNSFQGYQPVRTSSCVKLSKTRDGSLHVPVKTSCDDIWKAISDWGNCQWVVGCSYAIISEQNDRLRTLVLKNGLELDVELLKLDHKNRELIYGIVDADREELDGYLGHISLFDDLKGSGCHLHYNFTVANGERLEEVYTSFLRYRFPALQQMFGYCETCSQADF